MKNVESSLARTQKGTPLYMAPEVAYGEKYSEKVDIWSLCATFYYIFKSHGPYYKNTVKSSVELMMRKKDIKNYEALSEFYCANQVLRDIINYNLSNSDEKRMSADHLISLLEPFAEEMHMSNLTSEDDDKGTVFGKTGGTNFMDETLISQEVNPSQLNNVKNSIMEKSEYRTNAVSLIEESNLNNMIFSKKSINDQIEKKYDELEINEENANKNPEYYNQVNFIKPTQIEDTVEKSAFKHTGLKPSLISNQEQSRFERSKIPSYMREDSPELAVLNLSKGGKENNEDFDCDSIEEEFEDNEYNFSSEEEIKEEVNYEDEKVKEKDQYIFDSMMIERPDDLKEPELRITKSDKQFNRVDEKEIEVKLMDTFLSRTEGDELEYTKSVMPTPKIFNKAMENKPKTYSYEQNKFKKHHNNYMNSGNKFESTDELDLKMDKNKNYSKNQKKQEENFEDYGGFDDEDYLEDFDDEFNELEQTERTTFQGERQSESFYQTQFGKDPLEKTKNFVKGGEKKEERKNNIFQDFDFTN